MRTGAFVAHAGGAGVDMRPIAPVRVVEASCTLCGGLIRSRQHVRKGDFEVAEFIYTMKNVRRAVGEKVILDNVTMAFYPLSLIHI